MILNGYQIVLESMEMNTYKIRLATTADISTILNLNKEGLHLYPWTHNKNFIKRSIARGNYYVICTNGDEIMGAIKFYLKPHYLWISTMVVFKKFRKQGNATRLMKFAEKLAKQYRYKKIRLDTTTSSKVGQFYIKMGYKLIEEGFSYGKKYQIYEKVLK